MRICGILLLFPVSLLVGVSALMVALAASPVMVIIFAWSLSDAWLEEIVRKW